MSDKEKDNAKKDAKTDSKPKSETNSSRKECFSRMGTIDFSTDDSCFSCKDFELCRKISLITLSRDIKASLFELHNKFRYM